MMLYKKNVYIGDMDMEMCLYLFRVHYLTG